MRPLLGSMSGRAAGWLVSTLMWRFYFWPNHPRSRPPLATQARLGYVTPRQAERLEAACQVESRGIRVWKPACVGHWGSLGVGDGRLGGTETIACASTNDLQVSDDTPPPNLYIIAVHHSLAETHTLFWGGGRGGSIENENASCRELTPRSSLELTGCQEIRGHFCVHSWIS